MPTQLDDHQVNRAAFVQISVMAGAVVGAFENTLQAFTVLTVYMPIVAGMGGNASAQAMAVAVRGLATSNVDRRLIRRVLMRETGVDVLAVGPLFTHGVTEYF